jgi:hypothetical protein
MGLVHLIFYNCQFQLFQNFQRIDNYKLTIIKHVVKKFLKHNYVLELMF